MSGQHLLPPSSSAQEQAISLACATRCPPVPIKSLWDPQTCPAELLPWLAWTLSVDTWRTSWSVATKRAVIAAAMDVHRHKGSVASVRAAVEALGATLTLSEWFEYAGAPYTALIQAYTEDIADDGTGLTPEVIEDLFAILTYTAPVRVHFALEAGARFSRNFGVAAILPTALAVNTAHWSNSADQSQANLGAFGLAANLPRPVNIASAHWRG